jgi:cytochrome c2
MRINRLFSILVVFLLISGDTIIAEYQNDSIKNRMAVDSIKNGNELFVKKCARCHKLKDPAKYTKAQWPGLVNKMQKRAKITDEQKAFILSYLTSEAKKK